MPLGRFYYWVQHRVRLLKLPGTHRCQLRNETRPQNSNQRHYLDFNSKVPPWNTLSLCSLCLWISPCFVVFLFNGVVIVTHHCANLLFTRSIIQILFSTDKTAGCKQPEDADVLYSDMFCFSVIGASCPQMPALKRLLIPCACHPELVQPACLKPPLIVHWTS